MSKASEKPTEEEFEPRPEIAEIAERYEAGEKVADLLKLPKFKGIPKATIYDNFRRMGIQTGRSRTQRALKEVRKAEVASLAEEAERTASIAIKLGGCIYRRYTPLLDELMSKDMTLEMIGEAIMSWYESKRAIQKRVEALEAETANLREQLEYAYGLALPNFKYELRTRILYKYAQQLIQARMAGVRFPVKPTLKAFYNELLTLEEDIQDIVVKKIG